jgi:hypothetical protein
LSCVFCAAHGKERLFAVRLFGQHMANVTEPLLGGGRRQPLFLPRTANNTRQTVFTVQITVVGLCRAFPRKMHIKGVFDMGQICPAKPTTAILPCLISLAGLGAWPPRSISPSLSWLAPHAPRVHFSSAWLWLRAARANLAVGGSSGALARARMGGVKLPRGRSETSMAYLYRSLLPPSLLPLLSNLRSR